MRTALHSVHMIDRHTLVARMHARKQAQHVSWGHVAAQLGTTPGNLMKILACVQTPHGDTLVSILQWLGTPDTTPYTMRRGGVRVPASVPAREVAPPRRRAPSRSRSNTMVDQIMAAFHAAQADTSTHTPGTLPGNPDVV